MKSILQVPQAEVQYNDNRTKAQIAYRGLKMGMAHSLGNAIRRTISNCVPGYAPVGYTILGQAEFQPIPNVKENTLEISGNVAKCLVKVLSDGIKDFSLTFQGKVKEELRFGDFNIISGTLSGDETVEDVDTFIKNNVRILNPNQKILTLGVDEEVDLNMTIKFIGGIYFTTTEASERDKETSKNFIAVRSVFNPVIRATFRVEQTKLSEDLILVIETTGAVTPTEALTCALKTIYGYAKCMSSIGLVVTSENFSIGIGESYNKGNVESDREIKRQDIIQLDTDIEYCNFDEDLHNMLKVINVNKIGELVKLLKDTNEFDKALSKYNLKEIYTKEQVINTLQNIGISVLEDLDNK